MGIARKRELRVADVVIKENIMTEKTVTADAAEEVDALTPVAEQAVAKKPTSMKDFFVDMQFDDIDDSLEALLKAGAHFGHQKSRRHPQMMPYIFGVRGTVTIIDLIKTQKGIREAQDFLISVRKSGKKILFVTTKKQMVDLIRSAAQRVDEPYVVERWIGGTFTNFSQIRSRVRALLKMEDDMERGSFRKYTKFEQLKKREEIEKLNRKMGGLKKMDTLPGAIVVVDVNVDALAVREARKQGIPVVAITDTNVDPRYVDYAIPANDDAISSVKLILTLLMKSIDGVAPIAPKVQEKKRSPRARREQKTRAARKRA